MKNTLITILQGMVMGMAEIIPGVSATGLGLVMGIYDRVIAFLFDMSELAKLFLLSLKSRSLSGLRAKATVMDWRFGIKLGAGVLLSFLLLARILTYLLENFRSESYAFLFGLLLASALVPWGEISHKSAGKLALSLVSAVIVYLILGALPSPAGSEPDIFRVFIGGLLGVTGLVLPGFSGGFVLLSLGLYEYLVGILSRLTMLRLSADELVSLAVFGAGLVVGFLLMIRLLKYALDNFRDILMAFLVGMMLGSLRVVWPFFSDGLGEKPLAVWEADPGRVLLSLFIMLTGVAAVVALKRVRKLDQSKSLNSAST